MLRLILLSLLSVTLLVAKSGDTETLQRAAKLLKSDSKTDIFRAYNDYKNLYLQAVMKSDQQLRYDALAGIVKSGKKLRIDVGKYQNEYLQLQKSHAPVKKEQLKKTQPSTQKKVTIESRHQLKSVRWQDGRLVMEFNKPLSSNQLNYFKLYDKKAKRFRYVFDIHASMQVKQHNLRHKEVRRIKLAQFDQKTLRLVIENDKKMDIRFKVEKSKLLINLGVSAVMAPKALPEVPYKPVTGKRIVIDPGHGGKDGGAVGSNRKYPEKRVVMNISSDLVKILKKAGHNVYLTRTTDNFIKLQTRTKFANRKKADLFISIHANAVPKRNAKKAHGIETYFLSNNVDAGSERAKRVAKMENSKDLKDVNFYGQQDFINILNREKIHKSERLAHDLQRNVLAELRKHYNVKDGGVREGPFWILVGAQMPAVLVEVGFITHPVEGKRLASRSYQKRFAQGLADGIEQYFLKNP